MNFNTTNSTLRQLLGNGLRYRVPMFQRDYSWGPDEWDDLWQDMVAVVEEDAESRITWAIWCCSQPTIERLTLLTVSNG